MAESKPRKIVYLFGAGATHSELQNFDWDLFRKQRGLLVSDVSSRVIAKAARNRIFRAGLRPMSSASGSLNIELLISLIENSKCYRWELQTRLLKELVQEDIETVLSESKPTRFFLHKALFELHRQPLTMQKEELTGLISLNYDNVLDTAYQDCYGHPPRYCWSLDEGPEEATLPPLLKLHGSFNWRGMTIRGRKRSIEIIPLGSTKNYIHPPYGCIWNQALETLIACDVLRVIGCSLSQNDFHLIDLLFKAHLEKGTIFEVEIISFPKDGETIRNNYGFFRGIKTLTTIRSGYELPESKTQTEETRDNLVPDLVVENPFKTWLKYKSVKLLGDKMRRTRYLKKVVAREGT